MKNFNARWKNFNFDKICVYSVRVILKFVVRLFHATDSDVRNKILYNEVVIPTFTVKIKWTIVISVTSFVDLS